mgnify:CR=1 FL=1
MGAFYDGPTSTEIFSHAHAFLRNPDTTLLGFVDPDAQARKKAAELWNARPFSTLEEAFSSGPVDLVSVAVPDHLHAQVLQETLRYSPKAILLEKPVASSLEQARQIRSLLSRNPVPVLLNYSRRFDSSCQQLRARIWRNELGKFQGGVGTYCKGLFHNGSHLVDLCRFLLGEVCGTLGVERKLGFSASDPSVSGMLFFPGNAVVFLQGLEHRHYWVFELDLFFEKGRVRFEDSGFSIQNFLVKSHPLFPESTDIFPGQKEETGLGSALENAVRNLVGCAQGKEKPLCSVEDGVRVLEICQQMKDSLP